MVVDNCPSNANNLTTSQSMSGASKCPTYKYLPIPKLDYVQCPVLIHYSYHAGHVLYIPIYNVCLTQAAHPSAHHTSTTQILFGYLAPKDIQLIAAIDQAEGSAWSIAFFSTLLTMITPGYAPLTVVPGYAQCISRQPPGYATEP